MGKINSSATDYTNSLGTEQLNYLKVYFYIIIFKLGSQMWNPWNATSNWSKFM